MIVRNCPECIEQFLIQGKNMEIYIEGTRSRTGRLLEPKVGMLKCEASLLYRPAPVGWSLPVAIPDIIDAVKDGRTTDVSVDDLRRQKPVTDLALL